MVLVRNIFMRKMWKIISDSLILCQVEETRDHVSAGDEQDRLQETDL